MNTKGLCRPYVPTSQAARPADGFADPLKHYIIETVALEDRKVRARQLGVVLALVLASSSANGPWHSAQPTR